MDVREKLVELPKEISYDKKLGWYELWDMRNVAEDIADLLVAHGVTVQEDCKACAEATQNCIVKLQEQIAELRSAQEWISVKDRLPEDGQIVLTCKNGICDIQTYEARRNGWLCKGWFWSMATVTHWMPLPQPPKGE